MNILGVACQESHVEYPCIFISYVTINKLFHFVLKNILLWNLSVSRIASRGIHVFKLISNVAINEWLHILF